MTAQSLQSCIYQLLTKFPFYSVGLLMFQLAGSKKHDYVDNPLTNAYSFSPK